MRWPYDKKAAALLAATPANAFSRNIQDSSGSSSDGSSDVEDAGEDLEVEERPAVKDKVGLLDNVSEKHHH